MCPAEALCARLLRSKRHSNMKACGVRGRRQGYRGGKPWTGGSRPHSPGSPGLRHGCQGLPASCETTMSRHFVVKRKVEQGKCVPFLFQQRREHRTDVHDVGPWDFPTVRRGALSTPFALYTHNDRTSYLVISVHHCASRPLAFSHTHTLSRAPNTLAHRIAHSHPPLSHFAHPPAQ